MQIMPQMFDLFQSLRLVDWETITIFTCTNRECVPKFADKQHYLPEVAHIQVSDDFAEANRSQLTREA